MPTCPWCKHYSAAVTVLRHAEPVEVSSLSGTGGENGSEETAFQCPKCEGWSRVTIHWSVEFTVDPNMERLDEDEAELVEAADELPKEAASRLFTRTPDQVVVPGACSCQRCGRSVLDGKFAPHKLTAATLMAAGWRVVNEWPKPLLTCPDCAGTRPQHLGAEPPTTEARA